LKLGICRVATGMMSLFVGLSLGCNPSPPHAPISDECSAEVHNDTEVALIVTAFGRDKTELGRVEPGESTTLRELCRVDRVPVRGTPMDSSLDPIWEVAVFWAGETVHVRLGR